MKIRMRRSAGNWTRGQDLVVGTDISKQDADYYIHDLKLADEVDAKGNAVPRPGDADPSQALPNGGPGGSVSASSSSPAAPAQPGTIGSGYVTPRRRARLGS